MEGVFGEDEGETDLEDEPVAHTETRLLIDAVAERDGESDPDLERVPEMLAVLLRVGDPVGDRDTEPDGDREPCNERVTELQPVKDFVPCGEREGEKDDKREGDTPALMLVVLDTVLERVVDTDTDAERVRPSVTSDTVASGVLERLRVPDTLRVKNIVGVDESDTRVDRDDDFDGKLERVRWDERLEEPEADNVRVDAAEVLAVTVVVTVDEAETELLALGDGNGTTVGNCGACNARNAGATAGKPSAPNATRLNPGDDGGVRALCHNTPRANSAKGA